MIPPGFGASWPTGLALSLVVAVDSCAGELSARKSIDVHFDGDQSHTVPDRTFTHSG
jgi:hypothetical protein